MMTATERKRICVEEYRAAISETLRSVGLTQCDVTIVDSVQEWAHSVGIDEEDPFRAGMAVRRGNGVPGIVVASIITPDMQQGIIPAMEIRGFVDEVAHLALPGPSLEHLVLHEAAHLLLPPEATESDCDRWAFARLAGRMAADSATGAV